MHWIKATRPDGGTQWLNLGACVGMMRIKDGSLAETTAVYFGGLAVSANADGTLQAHHANAIVRETPEELLALPREMTGPDRFVNPAPEPLTRGDVLAQKRERERAVATPAPISPARRKRMS